jgi:hypothetical protein
MVAPSMGVIVRCLCIMIAPAVQGAQCMMTRSAAHEWLRLSEDCERSVTAVTQGRGQPWGNQGWLATSNQWVGQPWLLNVIKVTELEMQLS